MPKLQETFKSYIGGKNATGNSTELKTINNGEVESAKKEPNFLPGELLVCFADHVLRYPAYSECSQGTYGVLYCTNFKISFIPKQSSVDETGGWLKNKLYQDSEIPLAFVDKVFEVSGTKRKRLNPGSGITGYVKTLEIHCKNFQIHTFGFKSTPKDSAKNMVNAIVHYGFPAKLDLLFAFLFKPQDNDKNSTTVKFSTRDDWQKELDRLHATEFRVADVNQSYREMPTINKRVETKRPLSDALPEVFAVPSSLSNAEILSSCTHFEDYRPPIWCYTHSNKASLLRMAQERPNTGKPVENLMLQKVCDTIPNKTKPDIYHLDDLLPSIKDVRNSFEKLQEMCMPVSIKDVQETDASWLSMLDHSHWLNTISSCIRIAREIARKIHRQCTTVIIKERSCHDWACLVSSLVQILLDPYCRTMEGFQTLIEREWVTLGHRFIQRLGMVRNTDQDKCPLFLVFLDCVHQLQLQFPAAFQFSGLYLTVLWDTACLGIFENFVFNCDRERYFSGPQYPAFSRKEEESKMASAWDWSVQYDESSLSLFNNPLNLTHVQLRTELQKALKVDPAVTSSDNMRRMTLSRPVRLSDNSVILDPIIKKPMLKFWCNCYMRWLTPLQIIGGGAPSEYLTQCILVEEIVHLQHRVTGLQQAKPQSNAEKRRSELIFSHTVVPPTPTTPRPNTPNVANMDIVTSSFPFTPRRRDYGSHVSFMGTPISLFLENSDVFNDTGELEELNASASAKNT